MPPNDGNLLLGRLGNNAVAINWLELMKWKQGQQALVWVHHELWVVDLLFPLYGSAQWDWLHHWYPSLLPVWILRGIWMQLSIHWPQHCQPSMRWLQWHDKSLGSQQFGFDILFRVVTKRLPKLCISYPKCEGNSQVTSELTCNAEYFHVITSSTVG